MDCSILRNISENTVCHFYSHSIDQQTLLKFHVEQILLTFDQNYLKSMPERTTQYEHFNNP